MSPEERIVELEAIVAAQAAVIAELRAELEALKDRLGRDSGNSSLPPSRDGKDRRQRRAEEREARKAARPDGAGESGRRPGKQPGTPGVTMRRRDPDATVRYAPVACGSCAGDLAGAPVIGSATRQVVDIPEPSLVVTDHVVEKRRCSCGHITTAGFPAEATGPTCWGPGVKAAAVYLMVRQHVPLERAHEAMDALFGAPVSEGTLVNWTLDTAQRLAPFIGEVQALLAAAPVVCADETPVRCGTGSSFVHTVSTDALTLLAHHPSRGIEAITAVGVLDNYQGVIMHDGLNVYAAAELAEAGHAQCHAHLDRHLIDVGAWHKHTAWCEQMRRVLTDAQAATRCHHQPMRSGFGGGPSGLNIHVVSGSHWSPRASIAARTEPLRATARRLPVLVGWSEGVRWPSASTVTTTWASMTRRPSTKLSHRSTASSARRAPVSAARRRLRPANSLIDAATSSTACLL